MIFNVVCRALLALTVTTVFTTATVSSVFASQAGPHKSSRGSALDSEASVPEEMVSSLIVKPHAVAGAQVSNALRAFDGRDLSRSALVPLTVLRPMSGKAHVIKLKQPVTLSEARVIAARLMRNHPGLEYVEPDRIMHPLLTPTDPRYDQDEQWGYYAPAGANQGGANLPLAWDVTRGSASIVVAVIDTGYLQHIDFAPVLPGFDFITDPLRANDGDGRDADAHDPGNWVAANECGVGTPAKTTVWHSTGVIGQIAAVMNNGQGGTGVAPDVRILPVRVSGKCGALMSDMVDGMRWAAGLSVSGVPNNPTPAKILNISIGDHYTCGPTFQAAVTEIVNAGTVIAASTENNSDVNISEPANCTGVLAVTGHAIDGDLAYYANVGPEVAISAPGGGCGKLKFLGNTCAPGGADPNGPGLLATSNSGVTSPVADSYRTAIGTSAAAPHVAGVAALLLSFNPTLSPAQVKSILQSSARPFPAGSWCTTSGIGLCGAGLLDAHAALQTAVPPTVTITNPSQVVAPNITVSLSGAATAYVGRSISSYAWTQLTGASVGTIANQNTANASFTAPATGTYSFQLTARDSGGQTGTATATVRVNSPPVLTGVVDQTVGEGNALSFVVGATDVDGDALIFVAVSLPTGATLSSTGTFSWPNATPVGSDILTYFARDNDVDSTQGTVNISVSLTADTTLPTVPSSLAGSVLSGMQISLSWPAATDDIGVTGYQVERCQGVGCTNFALIASPTTTSYVDTGLTPGVSYSYRVRARDATGNVGAYSPITTFTLATDRTTLFTDIFDRANNADLGAAYRGSYVGLTTGQILSQRVLPSVVGTPAVEQYSVSTPNDQWSEVTIGALTSGVTAQVGAHVRMTNPTTYRGYRCFAAINQTNKAGIRRVDAGVLTTLGVNDTTTVWGVGDKLRCEAQGTTIRLYRVVGTTETLLISATDATYASGTTGIYVFVAAGGAMTNAQLSGFSIGRYNLTAPDTTSPTAPGSPTASAPSGTQVNLSWLAATDNVGVTGYKVERCQGSGCTNFALIASPTTTGYLDSGLTAGVSYGYRVRAQDATGNLSPYSLIITATPLATNRATLFTDPFDRPDSTDLGADYAGGYTGRTTGKIVLQRLLPTTVGTDTIERYTGVSTPANQWCEFTIGTFTGAQGADIGCALHMAAPPTMSLYLCRASINGTNKASLRRFDAGASVNLGDNTTVVWGPGDIGRCERQGTALRFTRVVGTAETLLLSALDQTYSAGSTGPFAAVATGGTLTNVQMSRFSMGEYSIIDATPPTAPGTPTASALSGTQINLSWPTATDNVGVTGYEVERCQGAGCSTFALIASPTATGYLDTGLTAGTSYSYRVRAEDAVGNLSPYSPIITRLTPGTGRTTLFTDIFDRANNADLGAAYTDSYTGFTTGQILTNRLVPSAVGMPTVEQYTGVSTPNDQWSEVTIGALTGGVAAQVGAHVRLTNPSTYSGYRCFAAINQTNKAGIRRFNAGASTQIGTNDTTTIWGVGDKLRCEIQGTTIKLYRVVGTTETLLISATDATYASGTTGIYVSVAAGGTMANAQLSGFAMGGFGAASAATVSFDAASSSATGNTTSTISWSHTVGNGTNRFLAVCTQARDTVAGDVAVTTVTAGGIPLTKVRADLRTNGGASFGTELWYLANPGIGAYTIAVTWAGALSSYGVGSATSYFGVDQVTPIDAHAGNGGTGATVATAITTVASHAVITDCAIGQANPLTVGTGQTTRVNRVTTGTADSVGVSTVNDKAVAGSETMDWTQNAAQNWVISAVSLRPAP